MEITRAKNIQDNLEDVKIGRFRLPGVKNYDGGTWQAQLKEHMTLDFMFVSSCTILGVEIK